jgi:hypothetical protein
MHGESVVASPSVGRGEHAADDQSGHHRRKPVALPPSITLSLGIGRTAAMRL